MRVKAKHHFSHKGVNYEKGQVFDAPDHEANNLIQQQHVERHDDQGGEEHEQPQGGSKGA